VVYQIAGVALGPLLYLQGRTVRRSIPVLPEPEGARDGMRGNGPRLRLLILGDSAAAGVGAATIDESLTGRLVDILSRSRSVDWRLVAKTGATTASTLKYLDKHRLETYDVCITSLGVNDVTAGIRARDWIAQQAKLRLKLREEIGIKRLVICGLPPIHKFPSLPQPLRWWLGARATAFDRALQDSISTEAGVSFLSLRFTDNLDLMASDGFHPGPQAYREWAMRVAKMLDSQFGLAVSR
jgi:lysophospholipase L1-like esterase